MPSDADPVTELLRRSKNDAIMVTHRGLTRKRDWHFESGDPLPAGVGAATIETLIAAGRLVSVAGETLVNDCFAQRYRAAH